MTAPRTPLPDWLPRAKTVQAVRTGARKEVRSRLTRENIDSLIETASLDYSDRSRQRKQFTEELRGILESYYLALYSLDLHPERGAVQRGQIEKIQEACAALQRTLDETSSDVWLNLRTSGFGRYALSFLFWPPFLQKTRTFGEALQHAEEHKRKHGQPALDGREVLTATLAALQQACETFRPNEQDRGGAPTKKAESVTIAELSTLLLRRLAELAIRDPDSDLPPIS